MTSDEGTAHLVRHCANDAYLSLCLMFHMNLLPLTKQLTNLAGNTWQRSLYSARAERVEYLLLHEFYRLKYVLPDKAFARHVESNKIFLHDLDKDDQKVDVDVKPKKKKKAQFSGGLVLEPKRGFYDKMVLMLDFNSLYPSIIQEFNICFTTVSYAKNDSRDENRENVTASKDASANSLALSVSPPDQSVPQGVLPRVIKSLVDSRKSVKGMLKSETDPMKRQQLDTRQLAIKIQANSMYGCLGFQFSRFYAKPLAELITLKGREILQNTVEIADKTFNLDVIYGDTDSIFLYTNKSEISEVMTIGNAVKREVNKRYKTLEIEIDAIYKTMLLLNK